MLVDAPCSAIGTWRRNPDARWLIDRQAIPRLADLQGQILRAAAAGVRPGGTLVYSVCTLTPAETLGVIRPFLEAHPAFRLDPFPHPLDGSPTDGTVLIWPQDADTDAMFIARMVRSLLTGMRVRSVPSPFSVARRTARVDPRTAARPRRPRWYRRRRTPRSPTRRRAAC